MGRLQFGVYNLAAGLLVMGCVFAVSRMSDEAGGEAAAPLGLFVYLALASRFRVLRLHDLGRSGWLLILEAFAMLLLATSNGIVATFGAIAALPLLALNLGMMLWGAYLTFVPGNPERNAYGDPAS